MALLPLLEEATIKLAWIGIGLLVLTFFSFLINWGLKFRLVGATIFTLLLSGSCWAFTKSYSPPLFVNGAKYAPIVFDNGLDLVVAQATEDFPEEAIKPSLNQIANNLRGRSRNGTSTVRIRLRKLEPHGKGISTPIIIGEAIKDLKQNTTIKLENEIENKNEDA